MKYLLLSILQSGVAEVMKAMGHEIDDISAILKDSAYKQVSKF